MFGIITLVDTDAQVSVLPISAQDKHSGSSGPNRIAANGSNICTFGTCTFSLFIGVQRFESDFFLADVSQPILGADTTTLFWWTSKATPHRLCFLCSCFDLAAISTTNNDFHHLLDSYPELTTPTFLLYLINMALCATSRRVDHPCMLVLVVCHLTSSLQQKWNSLPWRPWVLFVVPTACGPRCCT